MKVISTLVFLSLFGLLACKDCGQCPEPNYEYDPTDPKYICKAPDIAKNIVGSWKFETNLGIGRLDSIRTGYVTFDASSRMIAPDSLTENRLNGITIAFKTYAIKEGRVELYQFKAATLYEPVKWVQTYPLRVKENLCNRIELELIGTPTFFRFTR